MRIFDISIDNYKGIRKVENLQFGNFNSLVGKNDSGKSIILKALDAFFNGNFKPEDIYKGRNSGESTSIKIRFTPLFDIHPLALDNNAKLSLKKIFYYDEKGKLKIDYTCECKNLIHQDFQNIFGKKEQELNEILKSLGIDSKRSGRSITNISKIEEIYNSQKDNGFEIKEFDADAILKNIGKYYDGFLFPEYSLFEAEKNLNVDTTDFQNNFKAITQASIRSNTDLTSKLENNITNDLEQEFDAICGYMQKNVKDLEKIQPEPNCNWNNLFKFNLLLKYKNEQYPIPLANKGTGYKRLLMVAYFEYVAERMGNSNVIYGIEEPETYLHPSLQEVLLNTLKDISDYSQIFITTHSPVFAGSTNQSNIYIVKKSNGLSSYKLPNNQDELFDEVINELGIKPNYNLINSNVRKVVFVEGSNDCSFWEIVIKKFKGNIPNDILFIPCGGDQVDFFVNANLCQKVNRRFILILDSDKGAVDYATKIANKSALKAKVIGLGGEFDILDKREIENYYHKDAIQRLLGNNYTLSSSFNINDYDDIKETLKNEIPNNTRSTMKFKIKNNLEILSQMTLDEWKNSGKIRQSGKTDIEEIIELIVK